MDRETRRLAVEALGAAPTSKDYDRISERMDVPRATLRTWVHRARKEAGVAPPVKTPMWRPTALQRTSKRETQRVATETGGTDQVTPMSPAEQPQPMDPRVTAQQAEVATRLLAGEKWRDIEKTTGPSHTTLAAWFKDPGFVGYMADLKRARIQATTARFVGASEEFADTVVELNGQADRDSTRLAAAQAGLGMAGLTPKQLLQVDLDVTPHPAPAVDLTTPEGQEELIAMLAGLPLDILDAARARIMERT